MKIKFHVLSEFHRPGLHLWAEKEHHFPLGFYHPLSGPKNGWWLFETDLNENNSIGFKLFEWNELNSKPQIWESWDPKNFNRKIMLTPGETIPEEVWLIHGSSRIMFKDPLAQSVNQVRIHLVTHNASAQFRLYVWIPGEAAFIKKITAEDIHGPYYILELKEQFQHTFNFKFIGNDGKYEPDYANRTWSSWDGDEIWTHRHSSEITAVEPEQHQLTVHFRHEWGNVPIWLHLWQESSDFVDDIKGRPQPDGWVSFHTKKKLYSGLSYGLMFYKPGWKLEEHPLAKRCCSLNRDTEYWTLEGSNVLFAAPPERNSKVMVEIFEKAPGSNFSADKIEVTVDHGRANLPPVFEKKSDSTWVFWTYPEVVTSFRFGAGQILEPATHRVIATADELRTYIVLGRDSCLFERPPQQIFADPPFTIKRPGVIGEDGYLRFVIHARWCSRVRLKGEWQNDGAIELQSTSDGNYWWAQIPINEVINGLSADSYHGAWYQYILNDEAGGQANTAVNGGKNIQDPAAGWVAGTSPMEGKSRLVDHQKFIWKTASWQTPNWEYLTIYEIHPARFTLRNHLKPFAEIAREVETGYLRDLGFTALLLMPSNEYPGLGWGYNPTYYYAVKDAYGGPDELKKLVDVCHQHGIAVLLDVVLNHAGTGDNILWVLDEKTYFDGDTRWGAMINFSNDICKDFFAKCLGYWNREYHIDGFRFDMTNPIINGHTWAPFVNQPNSDNQGWNFLHHIRQELKQNDYHCLMMAEQFPNNWGLTNFGGAMDTQWQDDFHDCLVAVCRGYYQQMNLLANALKVSQTSCQQWYNVTPYLSSHDEVGNVNDRISMLPGWGHCGRGFRINKVAAAATLFARGIPMTFMGEEAGETGQFYENSIEPLDLDCYESDPNRQKVRFWWQTLLKLRLHNPIIQGPAPLEVHYVDGPVIAFSRGDFLDYFVVLNFSDDEICQKLRTMNLPDGTYRERLNSTYPVFQVEFENEYRNWGSLNRNGWLNIPDNGAIILERIN